jgi:beta-glucanase (GH16 family)
MRKILLVALLWFPLPTWAQTGLNPQWIAFNRASAQNSNLQCFTPSNVSVSGGYLVLTSKRQFSTCSSFDLTLAPYRYTSGYVAMRNFNFLYGTVTFRARFGGGANTGSWPVVWMLDASCQASDPTGTDDNCKGQEIDIAEILHSDFTHINQQIHLNNGRNDGCTASATDTSKNFHIYQLLWSPGSLVFKIDGTTTCTIVGDFVPSAPQYLKIDNFVGNFGGPVRMSSLPWATLVDYVQVTQGSTVIFNDDFSQETSNPSPSQTSGPQALLRWLIWAFLISLVVVLAILVPKFRNP